MIALFVLFAPRHQETVEVPAFFSSPSMHDVVIREGENVYVIPYEKGEEMLWQGLSRFWFKLAKGYIGPIPPALDTGQMADGLHLRKVFDIPSAQEFTAWSPGAGVSAFILDDRVRQKYQDLRASVRASCRSTAAAGSACGDGRMRCPRPRPSRAWDDGAGRTSGSHRMTTDQVAGTRTQELLALAERYAAHNYHPLPVVIASGEGAWVTDVEGKRYLDMLAAYSALNFGHRHPRLVEAARAQLEQAHAHLSRVPQRHVPGVLPRSRALANKDMVLTMNTGAEAVETAIKTARRWGYDVKGVAPDRAKIVVADGNFHGRTVTIVGFSTDPSAQARLRPVHPGVRVRARTETSTRFALRSMTTRSRSSSNRSKARRGWSCRPRATCVRRASSAPSAASC